MTKERRLAIEMWERIVEELENVKRNVSPNIIVDNIKTSSCMLDNLHWKCNCWFCQYVRHDYRPMKSREYIRHDSNGCQNCPLYKEHGYMLDDDECGCTHRVNTLWHRVYVLGDASAAKYIVKLLKGKYLGTRKEQKMTKYDGVRAIQIQTGKIGMIVDTKDGRFLVDFGNNSEWYDECDLLLALEEENADLGTTDSLKAVSFVFHRQKLTSIALAVTPTTFLKMNC